MSDLKKSCYFSKTQSEVICRGVDAGLTDKQIGILADPAFSPMQMDEILYGFLDGLSMSEIKVFANPSVSVEEMSRIRRIYQLSKEIEQGMEGLDQMLKIAEFRAQSISRCISTNKVIRKSCSRN